MITANGHGLVWGAGGAALDRKPETEAASATPSLSSSPSSLSSSAFESPFLRQHGVLFPYAYPGLYVRTQEWNTCSLACQPLARPACFSAFPTLFTFTASSFGVPLRTLSHLRNIHFRTMFTVCGKAIDREAV